jgi:hypothetical protein
MRAVFYGVPTLGLVTALAAAGITELILAPAQEVDELKEPTNGPARVQDGSTFHYDGTDAGEGITLRADKLKQVREVLENIIIGGSVTPLMVADAIEALKTGVRDGGAAPVDVDGEDSGGGKFAAEPREVKSRDARYDPFEAARQMLDDVSEDLVVAVALVGITTTGAVRLYASESTGQTLNLLAQGIKVADGSLAPEDD